jgi:riboflavin kinase/FMN adenylyltransferase
MLNFQLFRDNHPLPFDKTVVAIGNFDGVHVGHQKLIAQAKSLADQQHCSCVVLSFEPYPQQFFRSEILVPRLTILREKITVFKDIGVNNFYICRFNQAFALLSPQDFIETILKSRLHAVQIVVGEDFRFGYQRQGDIPQLNHAIPTHILPPVYAQNRKISSTWVREALKTGDLATTKRLLARDYFMEGKVVKGDQRGRTLGFPTANISLQHRVPALTGVYAVKVNNQWPGVANIGSRPTVDGKKTFLEVHLLDFHENLYGQTLKVVFLHKIRNEMKFDTLNALKEQITLDIINARTFL